MIMSPVNKKTGETNRKHTEPRTINDYSPRLHNILKPVPASVIIENFTPLAKNFTVNSTRGSNVSSLLAALPASRKLEAYHLAWQLREHYNHPSNPDLHGVYRITNIDITDNEPVIETENNKTATLMLSGKQKNNLINMWDADREHSYMLFHHGWHITFSNSELCLLDAHAAYTLPVLTGEGKHEFLTTTIINSNINVLEDRLQALQAKRKQLREEKKRVQKIFCDAYNNGATKQELASIMGKMDSFLNAMKLQPPKNPTLPDLRELTRIWEEYYETARSKEQIQSRIHVLTSVLAKRTETHLAVTREVTDLVVCPPDIETWYEYVKQRKIDYTTQAYVNGVRPGVINATQPDNSPYFTPVICYSLTVDNPDENAGAVALQKLEEETLKYVNSKIILSNAWVQATRNW